MKEQSIDRVREDLAIINAVIGTTLPFGPADVYFQGTLSVACAIFTISYTLGVNSGWPLILSGLPAVLIFLAYMSYFAIKSRHDSSVNVTRKKEYRKTLAVLVPVILMTISAKYWASHAGITQLQFGAMILIILGSVFVAIAIFSPWAAKYPRAYWLATGLPPIATGLWLPFCTRSEAISLIGCMSIVLFASIAIVMQYHLRQQNERVTNDAN